MPDSGIPNGIRVLRMEKVREALANLRYDTEESRQRIAALAEVEEWEARLADAHRHAARVEAERDQALRDVETVGEDLDAANADRDQRVDPRHKLGTKRGW